MFDEIRCYLGAHNERVRISELDACISDGLESGQNDGLVFLRGRAAGCSQGGFKTAPDAIHWFGGVASPGFFSAESMDHGRDSQESLLSDWFVEKRLWGEN